MAWWMAPLIFSATGIGKQLLQKPTRIKANTGYLDKYINNLKGDLAGKEYYHTAMRSNLKAIGSNTAKLREENELNSFRYGLEGSGITANQNLAITGKSNEAIAEASDKAMQTQIAYDNQRKKAIEEAEMLREKMISEARERNKIAEKNWEKGWIGVGLDSAANFASAGMQHLEAQKNAENAAKVMGIGDNPELGPARPVSEILKQYSNDPKEALSLAIKDRMIKQRGNYLSSLEELYQKKLDFDDVNELYENKIIDYNQALDLIKNIRVETAKQKQGEYFNLLANGGLSKENISKAVEEGVITPSQGLSQLNKLEKQNKPQYTEITYWDEYGNKITEMVPAEQWSGAKRVIIPKGEDPAKIQQNLQSGLGTIALYKSFSYGDKEKLSTVENIIKDGKVTGEEFDKLRSSLLEYVNSIKESDLKKSDANDISALIAMGNDGKLPSIDVIRKRIFNEIWDKISPLIGADNRDPNQLIDNILAGE